tara:strand:+ start:1250 stop:1381 length:132 start_codon:yes stop_codon:yes gene_type:complete
MRKRSKRKVYPEEISIRSKKLDNQIEFGLKSFIILTVILACII